jgi:hypothetical protein
MHRKKSNPSRSGRIALRPCVDNAPNGRYSAFMTNIILNRAFAICGCIISAGIIFIQCTPPRIIQKCPGPLWKDYASFQPSQVKEETARLERLLKRGDTTCLNSISIKNSTNSAEAKKPSGLEIKRRLFELSIHHANPDDNIDKIINYASFLSQNGGPDSLRYLNWGRAAQEKKSLIRERDSLETAISDIFEREKKESKSMETLKKEIKGYLKQRDSLNAVITIQQETIMKLQKIDVMMEQQRSKIQ